MVAATEDTPVAQLPERGLIKGFGALLIMALTITNAAAMARSLGPLQEVIKLDLHLDDVQMSLVQGLAAAAPVALLSIPLGRLVDRGNRVRLLFVMSLVWTVGVLLTAFANGFAVLFIARMLAGLGALCAVPAAISVAADLSRPENRGRSLLLLTLGVSLGTAIAFIAAGSLYGAWGADKTLFHGVAAWRAVHFAFAAVSALIALTLLLTREPSRKEVVENNASFGAAARELWARRAWLAPLFVGQVGVVMADVAATIWAGPILSRTYHLSPQQFAGLMGAIVLGPGLLGAVAGGLLADMGQKRRLFGGVMFGAVAASALAIPGALFAAAPDVTSFALLLSLFLFCGSIAGLVTSAAIAVLTPNETRGLALSAFVVVGAIVGFGLAPTLVAWMSTALGGEAHLGQALAATDLLVSLVSCAGFVLAALASKTPKTA
jgi:MFS family permease